MLFSLIIIFPLSIPGSIICATKLLILSFRKIFHE